MISRVFSFILLLLESVTVPNLLFSRLYLYIVNFLSILRSLIIKAVNGISLSPQCSCTRYKSGLILMV